ncbi:hypothetical protein AQUCO_05400049v1 [Aquilegia coerulea]|uniref:Hydroxyproline-rich glycoprotein family protein n=1 Tax=Aquilegia coerulea TaxID=218851 RepID=A0A2G5CHB5_AQUCA|nr:hypothetical protein AQUCO_05400049v1 [Aquilegia coerulea]
MELHRTKKSSSVLPELPQSFADSSYYPPLLSRLRLQAIDKLKPISIRRLSFPTFPHISPRTSLLKNDKNEVNLVNPELQEKHMTSNKLEVIENVHEDTRVQSTAGEITPKIPKFNSEVIPDKEGGDEKSSVPSRLTDPPMPSLTPLSQTTDVLGPEQQPLPNTSALTPEVQKMPHDSTSRMPPQPLKVVQPPPLAPHGSAPPSHRPSVVVPNESAAVTPLPEPFFLPKIADFPPPLSPLIIPKNVPGAPHTAPSFLPSSASTAPTKSHILSASAASPPILSKNEPAISHPPPTNPPKKLVPPPPPPVSLKKGFASPPPPPPGGAKSLYPKKELTRLKRSPQMRDRYNELKGKIEGSSFNSPNGRKSLGGSNSGNKQSMAAAIEEMTKRSAYYQQIENDVTKHAKTIMEMKAAINSFQPKDMVELVQFQQHVEHHLEKLSDETKVLEKFDDFPSKKLETLRTAAALYSKLKAMLTILQTWKIEPPVGQLLDRVEKYFNKIKKEVVALELSKDEESKRFRSYKIDFDFNIFLQIKESMVDVSSSCMELVLKERREAKTSSEGDSRSKTDIRPQAYTKMLWRAFQLAYQVYGFAGGQDDRANGLSIELANEIEADTQHE